MPDNTEAKGKPARNPPPGPYTLESYGPYRPLEVIHHQPNGTLYKALGPDGFVALLVLAQGAKHRPQEELVFTAHASVDPPFYAFSLPKGPEDVQRLALAITRMDHSADFVYKAADITFLRQEVPRSVRLGMLARALVMHSLARAVARTGRAAGAAAARILPMVGRAMPAAGTVTAIVASIAVLVMLNRTAPGEAQPSYVSEEEVHEMGNRRLTVPDKPFKGQKKPPCDPAGDQVELGGGCWVELKSKPPCSAKIYEHDGGCYLPVGERQPIPSTVRP